MNLDQLAEVLALQVIEVRDLRSDFNDVHLYQCRSIIPRQGTLANEITHTVYDDTETDPRIERRANEWATRPLITPETYAAT